MKIQKNIRFDELTTTRVNELATRWSMVKPLTTSDVVRECVRLIYESETKTKEKRR